MLRIQSHAQVIFSDPIVIRYGSGVRGDDGEHDGSEDESHKTPCPVLEFRIVNRLFNEVGGEIMDGELFALFVWCRVFFKKNLILFLLIDSHSERGGQCRRGRL